MANKIKHSKYKNTYLLYEFLIRQATEEVFSNVDLKESTAYKIIKKYFSKGELKKELMLYEAILNTNLKTPRLADDLINEAVNVYNGLSKQAIKSARYNLINELKSNYNIEKLFTTSISNYKQIATAYLFFESIRKNDIVSKVKYKSQLNENIVKIKLPKEKNVSKIFENVSKDEIKLAYHILVKRFNTILEGKLNINQEKFIQDYIYKPTNETEWVSEHINKINESLKKIENVKISSKDDTDKIIYLKLNEVSRKMNELKNKKIFGDGDYYKIMKSYELLDILGGK